MGDDEWFVEYMYSNRSFTEKEKFGNIEYDCSYKKGLNITYIKRDYSKQTTQKPSSEDFKWYFTAFE